VKQILIEMKCFITIILWLWCGLYLHGSTGDSSQIVELHASYVDDSSSHGGIPRMPGRKIYLYLADSTITVDSSLEYGLMEIIKGDDGQVIYSVVVEDGVSDIPLPTLPSGDYSIRLMINGTAYIGMFSVS
jgi:hypothetical protein